MSAAATSPKVDQYVVVMGGRHFQQVGQVVKVNAKTCHVYLLASDQVVTVLTEFLDSY
jgi:ribosomal protein S4E